MNGNQQEKKKKGFKGWWKDVLKTHDYGENPEDPLHYYDYKGAYEAGEAIPSEKGEHWPSKFKHDLHPNRFITGKVAGYPEISWWDSKHGKPAKETEVMGQWRERMEFEGELGVERPQGYWHSYIHGARE